MIMKSSPERGGGPSEALASDGGRVGTPQTHAARSTETKRKSSMSADIVAGSSELPQSSCLGLAGLADDGRLCRFPPAWTKEDWWPVYPDEVCELRRTQLWRMIRV